MTILSGACVFLAAALLVDGVFFTDTPGTPWQVWASIAVSAAAALLLVAGAVRERTRRVPEGPAETLTPTGEGPPAPPMTRDDLRFAGTGDPDGAAAAGAQPAGATVGGQAEAETVAPAGQTHGETVAQGPEPVYVVPGRPKFHRASCRHVAGREPQPLDPLEAVTAGYTPCAVCRPEAAAGLVVGDVDESVEQPAPSAGEPVVVVRGRYHRPDCRYVAVATEATEMSKAQARAGGALPCGVCEP